jgi:putative spermidine/putrescine transport system substrate-binding protein
VVSVACRRRRFLRLAALGSAAALAGGAPRARAAGSVVDVCIDGDTNVSDWWTGSVKPRFEAANPGWQLNVVRTRGGTGNLVIAERALAALKVKADPQVDYLEEFNPANLPGSADAGLWTRMDASAVPAYARTNPLGRDNPFVLPYRGSQVVLAYDSEKVAPAEVPRTWDALTAWIKAHPGQFIYGRPDRGGSGRNFVVRAIHEANGRDPKLFRPDNFSKAEAEKRLPPAWAILRDLQPSLYDKGAYPAGNNPTLQLLANGAVSMISAWSDQALQAIRLGALPDTVKLAQLTDLPFAGGFTFSSIPSNAAHHEAALKLAEFVLSPEIQASVVNDMGGFPGLDWKNMPADLQAKFADVVAASLPTFPSNDWQTAMYDGWYGQVATGVDRAK